MAIESSNTEELLKSFKERYQGLVEENQKLTQKIKENEVQVIKLLGAIETLEYLESSTEQPVENSEE
jgi:ferritin-like metal-binding protein YciE